jgi:nitrite reductase (NO-forming)
MLKSLLFAAVCLVLTLGAVSAAAVRHEGHDTGTPAASPQASPAASPAATPSVALDGPAVVELATGDMKFGPRSLTIPANTDVTLRITNKGKLPHDVTIMGTSYATAKITSGETVELKLNLAPGTYTFVCTVPGHMQAGMRGNIIAQ